MIDRSIVILGIIIILFLLHTCLILLLVQYLRRVGEGGEAGRLGRGVGKGRGKGVGEGVKEGVGFGSVQRSKG